jgi:ABC-2 type transport system ATP-binding protein
MGADATAIDCRGLTKDYGHGAGLFDLTLTVNRGEIFGLVGLPKAGKSTLVRLFFDSERPSSGSVSVFGLDPHDSAAAIRRRVGYLPEETASYPGVSAGYVLGLMAGLRGGINVSRVQKLAERLELDLNRRYDRLSSGNRHKVHLILALMHYPELLILDEPMTGLSNRIKAELFAVIRERAADGTTVVLSSSQLSEIEPVCDRVGMLRDGRLSWVGVPTDIGSNHSAVAEPAALSLKLA